MDQAILESEAMRLSPQQRALLADALLVSLDEEGVRAVEAVWAEEAERRRLSYLRGETAALDGPSTLAALRSRLGG